MSTWKSFRPDGIPHPFALTLGTEETLFVSGFGGHRPDGSIADDPAEQAEEAMRALEAHLRREGFSLDEVVWIHPYVTDIAHAQAMDPVLARTFGDAPPACGAMLAGVQLADPRMKLEFEAVAVRGAQRVRAA